MLVSSSQIVVLHDIVNGQLNLKRSFGSAGHTDDIQCVRFNHNNKVIASTSIDGSICLSHVGGQPLGSLTKASTNAGQVTDPFHSLAFSSGSRYLLSGAASGNVGVWVS